MFNKKKKIMECLVTKLKGVVNDDTLEKLGEMKFIISHVDDTEIEDYGVELIGNSSNPVTYELIGSGYFSDTKGGENIGTKLTASSTLYKFISNPPKGITYTLKVSNKYVLTSIPLINTFRRNYLSGPFSSMRMSYSGDLSSIKYLNLTGLGSNGGLRGNIAELKSKKLQYLSLNSDNVYGSIEDIDFSAMIEVSITNIPDINGDLSVISEINAPNLSNQTNAKLKFDYTGVSGDISTLILADSVKGFSIEGCKNITGSLSAFKENNPNCTEINFIYSGVTNDVE